ncbi:MAG: hypothetical protein A3J53_00260 [Candidatus Harrisonbacteria bacterium RIFCSPHIGHO2_02_FULL_40_20]|nr:MAG: hypothetical protein A3J53_00260 [Candidatus Harrisonbacteria bacterium RIFCSPHIGHO2_02_FULL_40_20]
MGWGKYNTKFKMQNFGVADATNFKNKKGQSLIELLLAIALGSMFISSAVGVLVVSLRSGSQNKSMQIASLLTQELLDKTKVFAEQRWLNVYNLTKSQPYYLNFVGGTFVAVAGIELIALDGIQYSRNFTVANYLRSGADDSSTQIVRVTVSWQQGADVANITRSQYVARIRNLVWRSSSPGSGNESPVFDTGVNGGAAWNTIMWQGSGGSVGFRIATSNSLAGSWNYFGPGGNPATYYQPAGSNIQALITAVDHNNKRYARYRPYYLSGSPSVNEVIMNYSP